VNPVDRRNLELRFQRQVGLSPGTVARIARVQRAVGMLSRHAGLPRTAAECGYADQPHFTREIRAMAGLTPTEPCASVQ
jgi:transcriptional regulator GlxA family with amidase domain